MQQQQSKSFPQQLDAPLAKTSAGLCGLASPSPEGIFAAVAVILPKPGTMLCRVSIIFGGLESFVLWWSALLETYSNNRKSHGCDIKIDIYCHVEGKNGVYFTFCLMAGSAFIFRLSASSRIVSVYSEMVAFWTLIFAICQWKNTISLVTTGRLSRSGAIIYLICVGFTITQVIYESVSSLRWLFFDDDHWKVWKRSVCEEGAPYPWALCYPNTMPLL